MATVGAAVADRVPAWKKIGLKLKNASDSVVQARENAAAQSNRHPGTIEANSSLVNLPSEENTPANAADLTIREPPRHSQESPEKKSKRKRSSEVEDDSTSSIIGHTESSKSQPQAISTSELDTSGTNTDATTK